MSGTFAIKNPCAFLPVMLATISLFSVAVSRSRGAQEQAVENAVYLSEGWKIQASAEARSDGKAVSSAAFDVSGWHAASVPTTVLSALVQDGVYKDIYVGKNLETVPTAPFTNSWWYRKEFDVSADQGPECASLIFEGINYRANICLNGERIAAEDQTFGAFRVFNLDVTGRLKPGVNVLAVEVIPPKPGDFTMGFVDWNPKPPDRNMGLFRPVKLRFYKSIAIDNLFVESKLDHSTWQQAELTIHADLINHSDHEAETLVTAELAGVNFNEKVTLQPREKRSLKLLPAQHPELKLDHPRLWWPWELGEPNLYTLKMTCQMGEDVSDQQQVRFGIREVADYINPQGHRGYTINGKKILIRGGGWADELLLHEDARNLEAQIQYARAMNLNTIRLEGVWGSSQRLYDLADENGLLIMVGWSCQWEWSNYLGKKADKNFGGFTTSADMDLAINYLHDQVLWLRHHPGIFVWVLGSDMLPPAELEKRYDALMPAIDPTRPTLKSCGGKTSKVSGRTAVKMNGPYDYVTPNYWYLDRENGGAFGFNTETGPGPQPPPLESLQRMFPANQLWPINDIWNFHCGRGEFRTLNAYLRAFNNRYGEAKSLEEFALRSQAANYEAIRPMYEAFGANLPATTGIIQWMLNPSWPKLYWQLYDYYLVPGGAFFGAKKGAAPVSIVYNYRDRGIYVVNETERSLPELTARIAVYDLDSRKVLETNVTTSAPVFGSKKVLDLSDSSTGTPVSFLDLGLLDPAGASVADNFYWLSAKPDVLDKDKTEWYVTPNKSFADFTALDRLPEAQVRAETSIKRTSDGADAEVILSNPCERLAFFIEMSVIDAKTKQTLTPVLWSDNYVSLPPGDRKVYRAHLPLVSNTEMPEFRLKGWNVKFEIVRKGG